MADRDALWETAWHDPDDEVADAAFDAWKETYVWIPVPWSLAACMERILSLHRLQHLGAGYYSGYHAYEDVAERLLERVPEPGPPLNTQLTMGFD